MHALIQHYLFDTLTNFVAKKLFLGWKKWEIFLNKQQVIKEDRRVLMFDSLPDYINSMKKQKVIIQALDMRTYSKSPLSIETVEVK